ncbi:voltage gated chloride channel-domain-containing protein [Haematococcus lacustris]
MAVPHHSMLVSWLYEIRSQFIYRVVQLDVSWKLKFLQYTGFNLLLAFLCSFSLYVISPAASGSGIPDVKAYLNGVESPIFRNFFRVRTFIGKVIGSALAVSASLIMGKEGPMLHAGSILAVILGTNKWMTQQMEIAAHWGVYTYNKELRDLVAIGAACGVTTAFKAPVGGVLFAMEMSTRWRKELTWRAFMACAITVVVVRLLNTICVGHSMCSMLQWGSLIWFQMSSMPTPYQQVWAVVILAAITGYLGCLYTSFNTWVCLVRKKWAKFMWAKILEVCIISIATSIIFYILPVMGSCKACDSQDPDHCIRGEVKFKSFAGYRCHLPNHYNDLAVLVFNPQGYIIQALFQAHSKTFSFGTMAIYAAAYWFMAAITYGAFIPSGLFTPSLIFGGCIGRMFAEVLVLMGVANETHVGMYALLGAAGFLGGLMRMSAAQALILMEMTQAPAQLPFLMLTLVLSKEVGDHFNYSVFDHQMMLKGLAFVGIDEGKANKAKLTARDVMASNTRDRTLYLVETGQVLQQALDTHRDLAAFPVTLPPLSDKVPGDFVGMISRKNIALLLEEHGLECEHIDLTPKVEVAPIIIPPSMPLPFVYRIVNAEGFNYVPVIKTHGPLEGMVSRTELVEVQNKKLDEFHLKDQIEKMTDQIDQGKIIQSMNLTDNIHAAKFKKFISNPVAATKEFMETDDAKPQDESQEYFMENQDDSGVRHRPGAAYHTALPVTAAVPLLQPELADSETAPLTQGQPASTPSQLSGLPSHRMHGP